MKKFIISVIGFIMVLGVYVPSADATQCAQREAVVEFLANTVKAKLVAAGIAANGFLVELYVSEDNSKWAITYTDNNNVTCPLALGDFWVGRFATEKQKGPNA